MSTLLEQAIIDAEALRESAVKSAEQAIIEKYAPEVKRAVETLLEQEMMPPQDEMMFEDPMLMQQLGLGGFMPQQREPQVADEDVPPEGNGWSISLIISGILLVLAWFAIPLGALGAWFYGPIEGFTATPVFSRFEMLIHAALFLTI